MREGEKGIKGDDKEREREREAKEELKGENER